MRAATKDRRKIIRDTTKTLHSQINIKKKKNEDRSNSMYSGNKGFNTELGAYPTVERASRAGGVEIKETIAEGQRS